MEVLSITGQMSGDTAIIIDDIISTGGTIIESVKALKKRNVKKIIVCATHGIFAGSAVKNLEHSPIDKIFVTDSVKSSAKSKKIETVTISNLIADCLTQEL